MRTQDWQQAIGWSKAQVDEMRLVGYAYIREGKWSDAITLFKGLCALDPSAAYDFQTLGALYLQKGESKLALEVLQNALMLDPDDETTRLNRAKALFMLGHIQEGLLVAEGLTFSENEQIASSADALLLAYRSF